MSLLSKQNFVIIFGRGGYGMYIVFMHVNSMTYIKESNDLLIKKKSSQFSLISIQKTGSNCEFKMLMQKNGDKTSILHI